MKKLKRLLSGFLVIALMLGVIGIDKVYGETGNIGAGETGGTYGVGKDGLGYTKHKGGVRISCYFARVSDADDLYKLGSTSITEEEYRGFEAKYFTSDNVRQVGKTIHLLPDGASADVVMASNQSVYDYIIKKQGYNAVLKGIDSTFLPYYTKSKSVVAKMPPVWDSSDEDWKHWIMGSDLENPSYENIPELTELMGQSISAENFDKGIYIDPLTNAELYGFYKLFIEPEADVQVNKKHQYLTVRDIAAMGETSADTIATYISTVFTYIANGLFLIDDEPALVLPNGEYMTANEGPYLVRKQSQSDIAEIRKQMRPGGKIYSKMGVGVINPQLEGIKRNKGKEYRVVKIYEFPYLDYTGTLQFAKLGVEEEQVTAEELNEIKEEEVIEAPKYGRVFLNDKLVTTRKLDAKTLKWHTVKLEDSKGALKASDIKKYTLQVGTLPYTLSLKPAEFEKKAGVKITADINLFEEAAQTKEAVRKGTMSTAEGTKKLLESVKYIDEETSYNLQKEVADKGDEIVEECLAIEAVEYCKDGSLSLDACAEVDTTTTLYLRYLVLDLPEQLNLIQYYKNGRPSGEPVFASTSELEFDITDNAEFNIKELVDISNSDAELLEAGVCKGVDYENLSRTQKTLEGIDGLKLGENVAVIWRIDVDTTQVSGDGVPQWRLSQYNKAEEFSQYATMKLKGFTTSEGCLAYKEKLIPEGTISVDLLNPSGNVAGNSLEKTNNWLFVQAVKKGNLPSVSLNSKSASVNVDGNINVIKSESGIKLANWLHSNTVDSKYGITSATKSSNLRATTIKTANLSYGIKSKYKYSHIYGVYYHPATEAVGYRPVISTETYDQIDENGNKTTVTKTTTTYEEYTYIDYPCECYTKVEDVGIDYTKAQYKLSVALKDYVAVNNDRDILKVADTKREENFKTTISKQNTRYLKVVPEVPMLFEDNDNKQKVVFAAGSQTRKISVVDYHILEYKLDSLDAYSTDGSILNKNAKQTANRLGLGNRPLIQKGANVNGVIEPKGELVVKSYALDVASSVKSTFGNSGYNSNKAHTDLISAFNTFKTGKADIALDIAAVNGTSSIHNGAYNTTKNLKFKQKGGTTAVTHTLIVRGGVLQKVDGKEVSYIKVHNKELYDALVGMKLVGTKYNTVLKTLVSGKGDTLTESSFATLANSKRGTTDIKVGSGWYTEDTTVLEVKEYTTRFNIPTTQSINKVPMKLTGLETPMNKASFDKIGTKGYYDITYTLTSTSLSSALGKVNVKMHYNTRTDNYKVGYGVSNTSIQDRTTGGF